MAEISSVSAGPAARAAIERCHAVMHQLRPHLGLDEFVVRVQDQMGQGYRLAYVEVAGTVVAVAGFRTAQSLSWGKFLYVDDLVTDLEHRSQGFGKMLLDWLVDEARKNDCAELHLDSGTQRLGAHRFYEREKMQRSCYHYVIKLHQL